MFPDTLQRGRITADSKVCFYSFTFDAAYATLSLLITFDFELTKPPLRLYANQLQKSNQECN